LVTTPHSSVVELADVAPAFLEVAARTRYCTLATVDRSGRPRTRVVQVCWEWDGVFLSGRVGFAATSLAPSEIEQATFVSCSYWSTEARQAATADCRAWPWLSGSPGARPARVRLATTPGESGDGTTTRPRTEREVRPGTGEMLRLEPWLLRVTSGWATPAESPPESALLWGAVDDGMTSTDGNRLTERERAVVRLVARGLATSAIGRELHLSHWTVQDHLKTIFSKVGVNTRGELVARLYLHDDGGDVKRMPASVDLRG
jgi:DNA-binding CsgD family transcriptional regulator